MYIVTKQFYSYLMFHTTKRIPHQTQRNLTSTISNNYLYVYSIQIVAFKIMKICIVILTSIFVFIDTEIESIYYMWI